MAWLRTQVEGKTGDDRARGLLAAFRGELYRCFATYRDALLQLADAVLCKRDRMHMLAELSLEPEHRHRHGALTARWIAAESISRRCAGRWLPAAAGLG
jgi:hypothetical protein